VLDLIKDYKHSTLTEEVLTVLKQQYLQYKQRLCQATADRCNSGAVTDELLTNKSLTDKGLVDKLLACGYGVYNDVVYALKSTCAGDDNLAGMCGWPIYDHAGPYTISYLEVDNYKGESSKKERYEHVGCGLWVQPLFIGLLCVMPNKRCHLVSYDLADVVTTCDSDNIFSCRLRMEQIDFPLFVRA